MSGKESLSLDEFATAPRKQRAVVEAPVRVDADRAGEARDAPQPRTEEPRGDASSEASKALRRMKRARMKGASHFVNVNLDRETKRRLKLASFNSDTSMQVIMEKAIRQYLDANGY
jgi:post-segregation antitoxin (ccd killing protein)